MIHLYYCAYCKKEIANDDQRLDYSPFKGLVHYECHLKGLENEVSASEGDFKPPVWLDELKTIVGAENVITPTCNRAYYYYRDHSTDFIDLSHGYRPDAIALPLTEQQVSRIVELAVKNMIPIIPRGAGTGFMGGAVAVRGGIIVDLSSMNRITEIDGKNLRLTVEVGARIEQIERALQKQGFTLGFDPGSAPVATIGGAVSTDQIGLDGWYSNYGSMGRRVLSLRVVLPDGSIVTTGPGLDRALSTMNVTSLFVGAEGTLGLITSVTVKMFPNPAITELRIIRFDSFLSATEATLDLIRADLNPAIHHTAEDVRYEELTEGRELGSTGRIVLGFAGPRDVVDAQITHAIAICESHAGKDEGPAAAKAYLSKRHQAFPVNMRNNKIYGLENIALPINSILEVYTRFCDISKKHGLRRYYAGFGTNPTTFSFGYIFDNTEAGLKKKTAAMEEMLAASRQAGGSISAVHGIGIIKRKYFSLEYDEPLLQLMRKVKKALDPNGIMNPGKSVYD
ncbi:MAG TPA: FAD-binding oxidoreductase [Candidatus Bathyarchaeia archaeon]|nr:FAD-binding oxidoreductase [Candidatus Bathyarchaeia archaeon]